MTPGDLRDPAPLLGADTDLVLQRLGGYTLGRDRRAAGIRDARVTSIRSMRSSSGCASRLGERSPQRTSASSAATTSSASPSPPPTSTTSRPGRRPAARCAAHRRRRCTCRGSCTGRRDRRRPNCARRAGGARRPGRRSGGRERDARWTGDDVRRTRRTRAPRAGPAAAAQRRAQDGPLGVASWSSSRRRSSSRMSDDAPLLRRRRHDPRGAAVRTWWPHCSGGPSRRPGDRLPALAPSTVPLQRRHVERPPHPLRRGLCAVRRPRRGRRALDAARSAAVGRGTAVVGDGGEILRWRGATSSRRTQTSPSCVGVEVALDDAARTARRW